MALSLLVQGERLLAHSAPGLAAAWGQARGTPGRLGWDPLACVLSGTPGAGVRASSELVRAAGLWPGCSSDLSGSAGEAGWPAQGSTFVYAPIWVPVELGRGGVHVGSVRAQEPARRLFGSLRLDFGAGTQAL